MNHYDHNRIEAFRVICDHSKRGKSCYRLVDGQDREIIPVNEFLDATAIRGLSLQTLRTYAYSLLSIWKWMNINAHSIEDMTEIHLVDYIRHLRKSAGTKKPPAPRSLNLRLVVMRSLYHFHTAHELPKAPKTPQEPLALMAETYRMGISRQGHWRRPALRVKVPYRLIIPLSRREVFLFFESLRTWRDLSIVSLMLFCGLRSREVLSLTFKDFSLIKEDLRVYGKGNKDRVLPLAPYAKNTISSYLHRERPKTNHEVLFVNLKGKSRGRPMTPQGLREIFRYHRKKSGIEKGNPHRFRHTFAADMVRVGVTLPVLMRIMGHTKIQMTMRYVNLSAEDVRKEFEQAIQRRMELPKDGKSLPKKP